MFPAGGAGHNMQNDFSACHKPTGVCHVLQGKTDRRIHPCHQEGDKTPRDVDDQDMSSPSTPLPSSGVSFIGLQAYLMID